MLKTKEQVEKRVNFTLQRIEWIKKDQEAAMAKVTEKIAKNADDPNYVTEWLACWMGPVNAYKEQLAELYKELNMLQWFMGEQ